MKRHRSLTAARRRAPLWLALLGAAITGGCTEAALYDNTTTPYQANKVSVSGTVCTDDLRQSDFPIKILFMIDMSKSLADAKNDPYRRRARAVEDLLNQWGKNRNYSFGVTLFGAKAKNLLTDPTTLKPIGFSRDFNLLMSAAQQIKSGNHPQISTCSSGRCRNYRSALSMANSIISGDVMASDPGTASRTTYVLVMFAGGPPVPAIGRCACRDLAQEKAGGKWAGCPWTKCNVCKVTCPAASVCVGAECRPTCTPSCLTGYYCDANRICRRGSPTAPITVKPLLPIPPPGNNPPDTYTYGVPEPSCAKDADCSGSAAGRCDVLAGKCKTTHLTCDAERCLAGAGNPNSCEEKLLVLDVKELSDFALKNGAAQLQLHTVYLPDGEVRAASDPFYPGGPGACAGSRLVQQKRAVRLLSQMSYAAGGGAKVLTTAEQIQAGFLQIGRDIYTGQDALVIKELVVFNENVLTDASGSHPDTDADGLPDHIEKKLGTCLSDRDSDGDGLGDALEIKLAFDPLKRSTPVECIDLARTKETGSDPCDRKATKYWIRYGDQDRDHRLNACEERLLGTDDTLYDTDADGIPDWVEFVSGTNYLVKDQLQDQDLDGMTNREEIRGHTDPQSNDSGAKLDLAYRYEEVDAGLKDMLSVSQPRVITGVKIINTSAATSAGLGQLRFKPNPPRLAWRGFGDMNVGGAFGPDVDISKPAASGHRVSSCRLVAGGGCTSDSPSRFITVQVDGPGSYPGKTAVEQVTISSARRNCLRFTVRNITLMQTGKDRILGSSGNNRIQLYFSEAPKRSKSTSGIFRIATKRIQYTDGPPATRSPTDPMITFEDDDFVLDSKK